MFVTLQDHPSEAEALDFFGLSCGTAEAVPYQDKIFMDLHVHAIALFAEGYPQNRNAGGNVQ